MRTVLSRAQVKQDGYAITAGQESKLPWPLGALCPRWSLVKGYKAGKIDIPEYLARYLQQLNSKLGAKELAAIYELGDLTFLCYCRDGQFCHTYYAIKWLVDRTDSIREQHPSWDKGFKASDILEDFVGGLDWAGECWVYRDKVHLDSLVIEQFKYEEDQ